MVDKALDGIGVDIDVHKVAASLFYKFLHMNVALKMVDTGDSQFCHRSKHI